MEEFRSNKKALAEFVEEQFRICDENQSGFLEPAELKKLVKRIYPQRVVSNQEVRIMLDSIDLNKDGKVSKDELMKSLGKFYKH